MILPDSAYHCYSPARSWLASFANREDAISYVRDKAEFAWTKMNLSPKQQKESKRGKILSTDFIVVCRMEVVFATKESQNNVS